MAFQRMVVAQGELDAQPMTQLCAEPTKTRGRACRNPRKRPPCQLHTASQQFARQRDRLIVYLDKHGKSSGQQLKHALENAGSAPISTPATKAIDLVERHWTHAAPELASAVVTESTMASLDSQEEENPCSIFFLLAWLCGIPLDLDVVVSGVWEAGFADVEMAGTSALVVEDLHNTITAEGTAPNSEMVARDLHLLGVITCRKRGRLSQCACLATLGADVVPASGPAAVDV